MLLDGARVADMVRISAQIRAAVVAGFIAAAALVCAAAFAPGAIGNTAFVPGQRSLIEKLPAFQAPQPAKATPPALVARSVSSVSAEGRFISTGYSEKLKVNVPTPPPMPTPGPALRPNPPSATVLRMFCAGPN